MITVIVPVYNVEKYLSRCIDSVVGQTYQDLEIILVDDGSTDNSGVICDEYAQKDSRIQVIHKENGGLSSARNAALDVAKGEYVAFVDSDDYVDITTFEKCVKRLAGTKAEACIFSHFTVNETCTPNKLSLEKNLYQGKEIKTMILPRFFGKMHNEPELQGFVCRQIFKRTALGNLRFRSEREYFAEDVVFDIEIYNKINSLCVLDEPLYYYNYVPDSLSNRYREGLFEKLQNLLNFMCSFAEKNGLENVEDRILNRAFGFAVFACLNLKKGKNLTMREKRKQVKEIVSNPLVCVALDKIPQSLREKVFAFLLKRKAAGLILALI